MQQHDCPAFHLSMDCFRCSLVRGKPELPEAEKAAWLTKETLSSVDRLPADERLLEKIEDGLKNRTEG